MQIGEGVLEHAVAIERSYGAPVLALRVESAPDRTRTQEQVQAAIATIDGADEIYWSVDDEPAGVIVRQWGRAADIGEMLMALSHALDSGDVGGTLVLHAPEPPAARPPLRERREELLECHVRMRGERRLEPPDEQSVQGGHDPSERMVRYFADGAALLAGIETALAWIGDPPDGAKLWSGANLPHRDVGEVRAHIAASRAMPTAADRPWSAWLVACWESDDRFRLASILPASGDVSLVEGGAPLAAGDWEPTYSMLLEELRAASAWGSYGFIKRGREPGQISRSLAGDWVPQLPYGWYHLSHSIYEDVLAPDAFGAQLLGAGYSGRIPTGADWERGALDGDAVLLLHRDPGAWFGEPLPPVTILPSGHPDPGYPVPEVILRAREDLGEILMTADVLRHAPLDPLRE
jgi:hypothetical protein